MVRKQHRGVRQAPQPHYHPMKGALDGRGNCQGCADFNPEKYGWWKPK